MLFGFLGVLSEVKNGVLYVDATSSEIFQVKPTGDITLKYKVDFGLLQWPENKKYEFMEFMEHEIGSVSVLYR